MLLLGMNSKRQRRPNVRLGEIGDVSAALSCVNSVRPKQNLEEKRYTYELENPRQTDFNPIVEYSMPSSDFMVSEPGVSPNDLTDNLQNRENWNPNSSKSSFEFAYSDETNKKKPKLDFGNVTRKGRGMKQRGRSTRVNSGFTGRAWISSVNPEIGEKNDKECCDDYPIDEFEDSSDHDTSTTDKEEDAEDYLVEPVSDDQVGGDSDEFLMRDAFRGPDTLHSNPESGGGTDKMGFSGRVGNNTVSEWLEDLGFSKYVGLFKMHEVDEEVLPELTFEDLKDMGITAVGSRRKLYSAIQRLKEGGHSG
ncbi:Sterile alpha motif domain [Macleaya cordata]|uniref:Sterile alpha motif domain n=1 Tax=Macleaya cordata TaxID=56857 RepID=A0A200Q347_MACCD|nr:Sterile alpha motif domain [Macleaya cordata]